MKKFLIVAAAISLASLLFASCTGKPLMETPEVKDKVEDAANTDLSKTVAAYFKDTISPNDIEKDISNVDMELEFSTDGLTETEAEPDDETGKVCWYDSENKLVYEQYSEDDKSVLVYHTSSESGRELAVKYADKDGVWSAYEFICDDYTYDMDVEAMIFTIEVRADVGTISYLKTADTQWTISSAVYSAEDGTHEYTYSVNNGKVTENDKIIENS